MQRVECGAIRHFVACPRERADVTPDGPVGTSVE
jgi:hypothetical protein